jgi:hypothetical protein
VCLLCARVPVMQLKVFALQCALAARGGGALGASTAVLCLCLCLCCAEWGRAVRSLGSAFHEELPPDGVSPELQHVLERHRQVHLAGLPVPGDAPVCWCGCQPRSLPLVDGTGVPVGMYLLPCSCVGNSELLLCVCLRRLHSW